MLWQVSAALHSTASKALGDVDGVTRGSGTSARNQPPETGSLSLDACDSTDEEEREGRKLTGEYYNTAVRLDKVLAEIEVTC